MTRQDIENEQTKRVSYLVKSVIQVRSIIQIGQNLTSPKSVNITQANVQSLTENK